MTRVFVGVVLYKNTAIQLTRLINSIQKQSVTNARITIQLRSNDSSDYSDELYDFRQRNSASNYDEVPNVIVGKNIGFGAAHNSLARIAYDQKYDIYLGLNPDGMLHHRAIEEMTAVARTSGANVLIESRQFPEEHPKSYDCLTGETAWCSGASFAIDPGYFFSLGGFDENMFMYCEDVDLSWRVRASGGRCLMAYRSLFFHDLSDHRASTRVRLQMLLSGRYLGWKWKLPDIQALCERELLGTGVYQGHEALPALEGTKVPFEPSLIAKLCDTRHAFTFSPARW